MTGRVQLTPEAREQLDRLDEWITQRASADIARRFVSAVLDHIEATVVFPLAGRARDDVRPGLRTTTFRKRTIVAYMVDSSADQVVVNVIGIFHGGQNWQIALADDPDDDDADADR